MSVSFPNASEPTVADFLEGTLPTQLGVPLSITMWMYRENDTANNGLHFAALSNGTDRGLALRIRGSDTDDPFRFTTRDNLNAQNAQISRPTVSGVWEFIGGNWIASADRNAFYNASTQNNTGGTGTPPTDMDLIQIGKRAAESMDCRIMWFSVWDRALTTTDALQLNAGVHPLMLGSGIPFEFFSLETINDVVGQVRGTVLSPTGSPVSHASNPNALMYPGMGHNSFAIAAAAAGVLNLVMAPYRAS